MHGMNGYYGQQYSGVDPRRSLDTFGQSHVGGMGINQMEDTMMGEGQSLDDIINQNNNELQRRRNSLHPTYRTPARNNANDTIRRASMMEFSSGINADLNDFQFDPNPNNQPPVRNGDRSMLPLQNSSEPRKAQPRENLSLDTRYQPMSSGYDTMPGSATFASPMDPGSAMGLSATNQYLASNMGGMHMDFSGHGGTSGDVTPVNFYSHPSYHPVYTESPIQQNMQTSFRGPSNDSGGGTSPSDEQAIMQKVQQMRMPASMSTFQQNQANVYQSNEPSRSPAQGTSLDKPSTQQAVGMNGLPPQTAPNAFGNGGMVACTVALANQADLSQWTWKT